jgi:hypothetical protein
MVKIVRGNACRKQIAEAPCLKVTYEAHEFYVATKEELSTFFACLPLNRCATARRKSESDTPRGAGGLVSGAVSKAVVPLVEASR